MSDAGLRRLLERAIAEPPADLEARVFRTRRHPWRWTAAAAAFVLVAGAMAWSLAQDPGPDGRVVGSPTEGLGRYPIGRGQDVATWLPKGFRESRRTARTSTWKGPGGVTIAAGTSTPISVPDVEPIRRHLAPGQMAGYATRSGATYVVGCSVARCWVRVTGEVRRDRELRILARRVAAGVTVPDRLSSAGTGLPPSLHVADARPEAQRATYVYRFVFDDTVPATLDGMLLSQLPFAYPLPPTGSTVTLTLGALPEHAGFDPVVVDGQIVGWMEMDHRLVEGPKPVISFIDDERLQGYLVPGRGFVWTDELFARRDPLLTTTTAASSIPTIAALPREVVLVNVGPGEGGQERRVDVFGLDGAKVASLPGWRTHDQAGPGHEVLVAPDGRLYALTRSGLRASSAPPPLTHDRCGPVGPAGRVCGSEPGVHDVEPTITLERDGEVPRRITGSPIPMLGGRWRGYWGGGAELGPDGRTILATFVAECESPSMYLIDLVTGRAYQPQTGGEIRESVGMGWSDAGEAIVNFTTGVCGSAADEPGVYRLRPDGTVAGVIIRFTSPDPVYPVLVEVPD